MGAEVDAGDNGRGSPPLHPAAARGSMDVARFLLSRRALASAVDAEGTMALHYAAEQGHSDIVTLLMDATESKSDAVDAKDADGYTPMQKAEGAGHKKVVKLLTKLGKRGASRRKQRRKG